MVIDIDKNELTKGTIDIDLAIQCDAKVFLQELLKNKFDSLSSWSEWIKKCKNWRDLFPPDSYDGHCLPKFYPEKNKIYPFYVMRLLSEKLQKGSTLVSDGGAALIYTLQAFKLKDNQRLISSTGLELPGFAISGSIGACVSSNFGSVITICEDRGLNLSSPELQTIAEYDLPIKILVLKSYGHSIIRNIQKDYFGSRYAQRQRN